MNNHNTAGGSTPGESSQNTPEGLTTDPSRPPIFSVPIMNPYNESPNTVNSNSNSDWGNPNQPKAGKANGPIRVNDPLGQVYEYKPGGNNQPFLRNIGMGLYYQYRVHSRDAIGQHMFTREQRVFILNHLYNVNKPL